jgi:hypothetical protein
MVMGDVRPIQTLYNGYRFRSRLEARWAVFLDRCAERYVYEDQGYALPSGPYLPDFFFPQRAAFLEVKPTSCLPTRHFEFWRVIGPDKPCQKRPLRNDGLPREIVQACEMTATLKLKPHAFVVAYGDPVDVVGFGDGGSVCLDERGLTTGIGILNWFDNLMSASAAARAARFEHGETG